MHSDNMLHYRMLSKQPTSIQKVPDCNENLGECKHFQLWKETPCFLLSQLYYIIRICLLVEYLASLENSACHARMVQSEESLLLKMENVSWKVGRTFEMTISHYY